MVDMGWSTTPGSVSRSGLPPDPEKKLLLNDEVREGLDDLPLQGGPLRAGLAQGH